MSGMSDNFNAAAQGRPSGAPTLPDGVPPMRPPHERSRYQDEPNTPDIVSAAGFGNVRMVGHYLQQGQSPNTATVKGRTALRAAMEGGHPDIVQLLLNAGADPWAEMLNPVSGKKVTDLDYAKSSFPGVAAMVEAAAEKFKVNNAAKKGDSAAVEALLAAGQPADTYDRTGATALMHAVKARSVKSVRLLLAHHANPNVSPPNDVPLIHIAVREKQHEMIEALADSGASVFARDMGGNTALERAKKLGDRALIDLLEKLQRREFISKTARQLSEGGTVLAAPGRAVFRKKKKDNDGQQGGTP